MEAVKRKVEDFKDCTSIVIGCAMRVHSTLGNGFQEVIYQRLFNKNFIPNLLDSAYSTNS
jgi:hypothetical protein